MLIRQSNARDEVLRYLSDRIVGLRCLHPLRVAVDGVDGAGKTIMADELAGYLERRGRTVIRASIDGFHRPRAERYARGPDSPEGFYYDSFDHVRVRMELLEPLGPGGDLHYRTAVFDWRKDTPIDTPVAQAAPNSILIFDGIFVQRPELAPFWDFGIFLQVDFRETLRRSLARDARPDQTPQELERRFWTRYAAGQRIYLSTVKPEEIADVVIDNNDPQFPRIVRNDS